VPRPCLYEGPHVPAHDVNARRVLSCAHHWPWVVLELLRWYCGCSCQSLQTQIDEKISTDAALSPLIDKADEDKSLILASVHRFLGSLRCVEGRA
jgi:hypothetical protein